MKEDQRKMEISELIRVHAIGYSLQDVKVQFNYELKIEAPEASIEAKRGEILSIPRWVANVLDQEKLVSIQDTDMVVALKQAVVRENVQGDFDLSTLEGDFYIKANSYIQRLPQEDHDKVESMLNSLVRKRQGKIIKLADSSKMTSELAKKLTIEERTLFDYIHTNSIQFKKQILGEKN
jgi:DNA replication factor GINS